MKAKLLSEEQKDLLNGIYFKEHHVFSPILDANDNWVLGLETAEQTTNPDFQWVKDLPEIDFEKRESRLREELAKYGISI